MTPSLNDHARGLVDDLLAGADLLRVAARTAAAKAVALSASATRVHPTVTAMRSGSDHSSTSASIPLGTAEIALTSRGLSKARAMPLRCSR